ncbi:hypothetical protein DFO66_10242 [Brevibacterium sanguinis]|uniref:Uncharacterized protein n=2 Tax=Brevibacterium TaxID=1696 RepID=A0A366INF6_9MICO|nr:MULTISPECIES: hypothetical protein [Brevibacterium]RBP66989.1 hypothetical protein DFO66_10242 [Brevibacterium sanguinis]RBP73514.1 hypothetical protein DFO65_10242 [Brevibacterium celere]
MTGEQEGRRFAEIDAPRRLAAAVVTVPGVRELAPGLRSLVASAAAKVLRREGGEALGVDVIEDEHGPRVRIDAHLDDSRRVSDVVDEIVEVVAAVMSAGAPPAADGASAEESGVRGPVAVDLRIVSRTSTKPSTVTSTSGSI